MGKALDFYFDVASPASYLAWARLPELAKRTGTTIHYKPIYAWGLFKEAGTTSPVQSQSKIRWFARDMVRWAKKQDIPFQLNMKFPFPSLTMMRGLIAYQDDPVFHGLTDRFFHKMWVEPAKMDEEGNIRAALDGLDVDADDFFARTQDPAVKQQLTDATRDAAKAGVFGVPSFGIDGKIDWGQDRMDFVEEALTAAG